jgi:hypothetical protein
MGRALKVTALTPGWLIASTWHDTTRAAVTKRRKVENFSGSRRLVSRLPDRTPGVLP